MLGTAYPCWLWGPFSGACASHEFHRRAGATPQWPSGSQGFSAFGTLPATSVLPFLGVGLLRRIWGQPLALCLFTGALHTPGAGAVEIPAWDWESVESPRCQATKAKLEGASVTFGHGHVPMGHSSPKPCLAPGDANVGGELCFVLWGGDFCPSEQGVVVGDAWSRAAQRHIPGMWL